MEFYLTDKSQRLGGQMLQIHSDLGKIESNYQFPGASKFLELVMISFRKCSVLFVYQSTWPHLSNIHNETVYNLAASIISLLLWDANSIELSAWALEREFVEPVMMSYCVFPVFPKSYEIMMHDINKFLLFSPFKIYFKDRLFWKIMKGSKTIKSHSNPY